MVARCVVENGKRLPGVMCVAARFEASRSCTSVVYPCRSFHASSFDRFMLHVTSYQPLATCLTLDIDNRILSVLSRYITILLWKAD